MTYTGGRFHCGRCGASWGMRIPEVIARGAREIARRQSAVQLRSVIPVPGGGLNPNEFRFARVVETPRTEAFARTERKVARNNTAATITDTEEISWTVARSVTVDHQRATIHGSNATLTVAGFASLGQTLQAELRGAYALSTEMTLTRTKTVSAEIPPRSSIELVLTWKIIRQPGIGQFTGMEGLHVDIPFEVDMDLALDWQANHVTGQG
ncbi:hypothetical protein ACFYWX_32390 [Streptomyces sp. NPDC002888]|uniref:hypothetical protein n=1 Tax=Streptomyces sp. NPDC002888 TaxID=3364668 RepID=UPI00369112B3